MTDSTREKNRLEKYLATDTPPVIAESVEAMISQLSAEIKHLDNLIRSHLNQHPELKKDFDLLTSIKSVGYQLGLNMLVILRSHDFATAEQTAAFLGVVPVEKYSGTSVRGCPKLSKIGPPEIRAKLYLASLCDLRFNPLMKAMYERLCQRGKARMCAIGALMLNTGLLMRVAHVRRYDVVTYGTGVTPPKPGVSRYILIGFTYPIPILLSYTRFQP